MTNTVLLKRSNTANSVPSAGSLTAGELALNYTDGNLFYKNNAGVVTLLASNQQLSVTGNITASAINVANINLSSLGNQQIPISYNGLLVGGIDLQWQFANARLYTTGLDSNGAITTSGIVSATGNITSAGNVSANYFIGNGSQLTGISAGSGNAITNGTSNVSIPTANGSIYINDDGVANAAIFGNGSLTLAGSFSTPKAPTASSTIAESVNAMWIGPVTIDPGTVITVPTSSTLYIYSP